MSYGFARLPHRATHWQGLHLHRRSSLSMESNNGIYSLFLPETVPASARLCLNLKAKTDFFVVSTDWSLIRFIVLVLSGSLVKAKFHYASWFEADSVKAKFHYTSWFEAGSKLVADQFEAKFHYAIWFEAGRSQVRSWSATTISLEPVCDQLGTCFESASNQLA